MHLSLRRWRTLPRRSTTDSIALSGYDSIFQSTVPITNSETIVHIPLAELHPPEFHPFHVSDDDAMTRLVNGIRERGVEEPGIVRPLTDGGYELLCGNRRKRACEILGISTLPVIIKELDDDSAVIEMVDSNLRQHLEQREKLLYSEKAWAYRMKLEALDHQGIKSDVPGQLSVDILCEQTGESKSQIFRIIRLTELIYSLLDRVDTGQLAFNPAVELSYLSQAEQTAVADAMDRHGIKPSLSQAVRLRKPKKAGELTLGQIDAILAESKKSPKDEPTGTMRFRQYFPPDYSQKQMETVISALLKEWKAAQDRIRDGGATAVV